MVKIKISHGVHEGGTKFYTSAFVSGGGVANQVVIKNFGKVGQNGQVKSELRFDAAMEHFKTIDAKRKRDYYMKDLGDRSVKAEEFTKRSTVAQSLMADGVTLKMVEAIVDAIGKFDSAPLMEQEFPTAAPPVDAEPKPEPVRSANWGSW